jgi:prevent-host-death family protein
MCYAAAMERIPIRELRNQVSRVVRRAQAGERLIITVDGVPTAEIGPVGPAGRAATLDELIGTGGLVAPRHRTPPSLPKPMPAPSGGSSADVLAELRER